MMKLYLTPLLDPGTVTSWGYDSLCLALTQRVGEVDHYCSEFLSSLNKALLGTTSPHAYLDFSKFFSRMKQLSECMLLAPHINTQLPHQQTDYDRLLNQHHEAFTRRSFELYSLPYISPEMRLMSRFKS
jgi:hypothetical protein